jgi:hypothetical protein
MGPPGEPAGQNRWLLTAIAIGLVAVIIGVALGSGGDGDDDDQTTATTVGAPGEIFLQEAAAQGPDPFTDSAAAAAPSSTVPSNVPVTLAPSGAGGAAPPTAPTFPPPGPGASAPGGTTTVRPLSGSAPGLYGGTGDQRVCDKQQMIDFLGRNPAKAAAFARVQGIATSEVGSYVDSLTPVLLRSDTRVTNHGFRNGRPTARQTVLQAGTAVMVDNRGVPRVRCACGNPLLPPQAVQTAPRYTGPAWPGFSPTNVTVIQQSTTVINVITVINVTNGTPYGQPTGPGYPAPVPLPALTTTTLPPTTTPATAPPGTAPPVTASGCTGAPGELLERLRADSAAATGDTSRTYAPGCGYRIVFSGDTDWNTNNSFQRGFDSHYCYDPQYCSAGGQLYADGGGLKVNGGYPWQQFGAQPPPFNNAHTYTYTVNSIPSGRIALTVNDVAHDDNAGTFTVEIYRA